MRKFTAYIIYLLILCTPAMLYGASTCIDCGGDATLPGNSQVCSPGESPTTGQVLKYDGVCWDAANDATGAGGGVEGGDLDNGEFCIWNGTGSVLDCNVPLASLANLNTLLSTALVDTGTLTNGRLCTWDNSGTEIDCDTTNAPTASALAANPTDCSSNQFATAIAASGNLTCSALTDTEIPNNITIDNATTADSLETQDSDAFIKWRNAADDADLDVIGLTSPDNYIVLGADADISGVQIGIAGEDQLQLLTQSSIKFYDSDSSHYQEFAADGTISASQSFFFNIDPTDCTGDGNDGKLTIDDSNVIVCAPDEGGAGGSGDIEAVGSCTSGACGTEGGNDFFPFIYEGSADTVETTFAVTDPTSSDKTITFPNLTGTVALSANKLDFFAATTSAELKGVISDETGTGGALVFATSPTLTTPTLGAASATSINKVAITPPATSATLTIADGKTATFNNTMSFSAAGDSGVFTLPNATATLVGRDTTDTLTNKTISGASNTFSNIPWASLVDVPAFRKTLFQLRPQANEPPASSFATISARNAHPTLRFNGNVCAIWSLVMPNTYGGNGVTVDIIYASTETSNDTDWDVSMELVGTSQDVDSDSFASAVSCDNNNNNGTSGIPTKVSCALTSGAQMDSCVADSLCRVRICRDDTADTGGADTIDFLGGQIRETP